MTITTDTPVTRLRADLAQYVMRHEGLPITSVRCVHRDGLHFITLTTPRRMYEANHATFEGAFEAVYALVRMDVFDTLTTRSVA